MAGRSRRLREDQEHTEARDAQGAAGTVSMAHVGRPEDDMNQPERDYLDDIIPGQYRRIANDPEAARAMCALVLDAAFDRLGDSKEVRDLATLANVWLRLADQASRAQESSPG